jgi:hypothetical protein
VWSSGNQKFVAEQLTKRFIELASPYMGRAQTCDLRREVTEKIEKLFKAWDNFHARVFHPRTFFASVEFPPTKINLVLCPNLELLLRGALQQYDPILPESKGSQ